MYFLIELLSAHWNISETYGDAMKKNPRCNFTADFTAEIMKCTLLILEDNRIIVEEKL